MLTEMALNEAELVGKKAAMQTTTLLHGCQILQTIQNFKHFVFKRTQTGESFLYNDLQLKKPFQINGFPNYSLYIQT